MFMRNSPAEIILTHFRLLLSSLLLSVLFISCGEETNGDADPVIVTASEQADAAQKEFSPDDFAANVTTELGKGVRSIFQDTKNNYWFGTDDAGVYRYNGKTLHHFTEKDGLPDNQVQSIQEDKEGNIWFGMGGFKVSCFNGKTFRSFTATESLPSAAALGGEWKAKPDDLWFYAGGEANTFTYLPFPKAEANGRYSKGNAEQLSAYGLYCLLKDRSGNLWFGTQTMGVCRFNGKEFTWFSDKGLGGPAVRALFEDRSGNLWFGNNGNGLFMYDGKALRNITEEHALGNPAFVRTGKGLPGTLARVWCIEQDSNGDIWIGTIDAGLWRYDGKKFTNYTLKDGLPSNAINTIYKTKTGELWFGTEGTGVCRFDGLARSNDRGMFTTLIF